LGLPIAYNIFVWLFGKTREETLNTNAVYVIDFIRMDLSNRSPLNPGTILSGIGTGSRTGRFCTWSGGTAANDLTMLNAGNLPQS
jgi:hypothetical protein